MPANFDLAASATVYTSWKVRPLSTISWVRWQATNWPGRPGTGSMAGSVVWHMSVASGQRGANGQPLGMLTRFIGEPGIGTRRLLRSRSERGTAPSRPMVYGMAGWSKMESTSAFSTGRPAYMTTMSSATPAITPRSWVMKMTAAPVSRWALRSTSSTWAWIVTSSAVVGSSAMITSGSLAMAMAIITRWRMPPENSCGKDFRRSSGSGMPTRFMSSMERS